MRSIFALLAAVLYLILTMPVLLVLWIVGKINPTAKDNCSLHMVQWIFRVILRIAGIKVTVLGQEHVPQDQAVLYILNHRSIFDIVLTYARCPGRTGYIAKKELAKIPLLNLWMKWVYCLFLDRTDIREGLKTILTAIDYVKSGISIAVFPEGTRGRLADEAELLPFHEGSFKVAVKTGCPIIPVCISHSSAIFEDHFPWVRATHVVLEYGAPIYPNDLPKDDKKFIGKYVQNIMQETLQKNKTL